MFYFTSLEIAFLLSYFYIFSIYSTSSNFAIDSIMVSLLFMALFYPFALSSSSYEKNYS